MKKSLAIFMFVMALSFNSVTVIVGQKVKSSAVEAGNKQSQDSDKPDVALKITSKPRVSLDSRCREKGEGTVRLRVTFHENKKVTDVQIVQESACYYFDQDAIKAAKRVKFEPALKNGQPVTTTKMLEYNFRVY